MKAQHLLLILSVFTVFSCAQPKNLVNTYYVRTDGNDANSGIENTPEAAWKTMDYAFSQLEAGDQLYINDGHYETQQLRVENLHGTRDKITKISAVNSWKAIVTQETVPTSDEGVIVVSNSSYVEISGFEISDTIDTGVGITVRDSSHHVLIKNNYVHDCGCNGIASRTSDYLVFDGNVIRDNAKRNEWNCSGMSIWHPIEHDQKAGYHIKIINNVAFENECDLPFRPLGYDNPTDGNGIIVDDFRNTQGGGQEGGYHSRVLVQNNLSFNNGGRGINVYESDNVDVINNTSFHNLRIISKYMDFPGEITLSNSQGSRVINNLAVKNPELPTKALRCYDNDSSETKIYNNLIIGEVDFCGQTLYETNNIFLESSAQDSAAFANPSLQVKFRSASDFREYFKLTEGSAAIDAGSAEEAPAADQNGLQRPLGKGIDIGCFEFKP